MLVGLPVLVVWQALYIWADRRNLPPSWSETSFEVDMVYTWIGMPSKAKLEVMMAACPHEPGGVQRWRDLGTFTVSLEHSLRNLPWIRRIYIVTDGLAPCWISDPKVKFVTHKEIWPSEKAGALPTFASTAIESYLHRIPGLTEHFIKMDDDLIFLKPLAPTDLFATDGTPRFFPGEFQEFKHSTILYLSTLIRRWTQRFEIGRAWPPPLPGHAMLGHMPSLWRKSLIEEAQATWPGLFEKIHGLRCRSDVQGSPSSSSTTFVYNWYHIVRGNATPIWNLRSRFIWGRQERVEILAETLSGVLKDLPDVLCLNDDLDRSPNGTVFSDQLEMVEHFLSAIRPKPSGAIDQAHCVGGTSSMRGADVTR